MPSPNPTVRRQHSGNAVPTTLSAPIVNATDTSFTIVSATGWPDGSVGNFVVTINAGQADVEKILCSTRVGTTVNVTTRGYDSTTAAGHAAGAAAIHSISAVEVDEMNQHTNATSGVHGAAGAVVGTTDSQTLTNKTLTAPAIATISNTGTVTLPTATTTLVGRDTTDTLTNKTLTSPTVNGGTLDAASTVGGVSGTSLAADRTAWTTYTPTLTNVTGGAATGAYKQVGKTLHLRVRITAGTSNTFPVTFTLPGGMTAAADQCLGATKFGNNTFANLTIASGAGTITGGAGGSGESYTGEGFNAVIEIA